MTSISSRLSQRRRLLLLPLFALLFVILPFLINQRFVLAKTFYTYQDDQGNKVITDAYDRIPSQYRLKAIELHQQDDSSKPAGRARGLGGVMQSINNATIHVPGMSHYQSHALTVAGGLALLCLALRNFSGSHLLRFLSLWGLVMLGLVTPLLIYFSQDAPLDVLRGGAAQIQTKQQEHLKNAP